MRSNDSADRSENAALGITEFRIADGAESTTIVGVDAQDNTIARLDLIHGQFTWAAQPGDESSIVGQVVDGRSLNITIKGQTFAWRSWGFSDTSQMPSLRSSLNLVTAFAADPQVRPILDQWKIGWKNVTTASASGEVAYDSGIDLAGSLPQWCDFFGGTGSCPIQLGTTPACNGGVEYNGVVVTDWVSQVGYNENLVTLLCGSVYVGTYGWKSCPFTANSNGTYTSTCGTSANKCTPCVTVPYNEGYDNGVRNEAMLILEVLDPYARDQYGNQIYWVYHAY